MAWSGIVWLDRVDGPSTRGGRGGLRTDSMLRILRVSVVLLQDNGNTMQVMLQRNREHMPWFRNLLVHVLRGLPVQVL